ncbi:unnamed protein product [Lactuca saligna]|uniref:Uncharacterized protein n=1 Tax=Lactuca saligna TaxID=75948 RepID=A0AA36DW84_LACSI|nr:unnamed protein product [Lactuca saligna]
MYVPNLLGGIGDVLGDGFATLGRKEIVVVPSSSETSSSPFIDSVTANPGACSVLRAYVPGWVVIKDSLLLEDIAAQEWSYYAHPPATMKLLAAQSAARMAINHQYAAAQTSTLWLLSLTGFAAME